MTTTDTNTEITMTNAAHAYVWKSLNSTVAAYGAAAQKLAKDITCDPRNALQALGWQGDFAMACWEADTANEIMHGAKVIMKREGISAEDALEQVINYVRGRVRDELLRNAYAGHSTSPASNTVDYYKAEAAARWLRDMDNVAAQLAAEKKAE